MQINDLRTPPNPYNLSVDTWSSSVANGNVVEIEAHSGQFIKIPNKGDLRQRETRRFLDLGTGQVLQVPRHARCRVVDASLSVE